MDRAFKSGASATPPTPPASPSIGYASQGDAGSGVPPTKPGAWWYHMVTEELRNIVVAGGLTPSQATVNQVLAALQAMFAPAAGRVLAAVNFDGFSGAINYAKNVSSVTVNSAGDYTITFASGLPSVSYLVLGTPSDVAASAGAGVHVHAASGSSLPTLKTAAAVRVATSFVSAGPAGVSGGFKDVSVLIVGG